MWQQEYEKLNSTEKEEFSRVVNLLLARTFILRDKYSSRKNHEDNHEYRFLERPFCPFSSIFEGFRWEVEKDNITGSGPYNLMKSTGCGLTKILPPPYVLRLLYDEAGTAFQKGEIINKGIAVVEKMITFGLTGKKPPTRFLRGDFLSEKDYILLTRSGDFAHPENGNII
jgi:hypothetical protein